MYWTLEDNENKEKVAVYLNNNKGRLHESLISTSYGNNVPWILFVYDIQASFSKELEILLEKCREDWQTNDNEKNSDIDNIDFNVNDCINFTGNLDIGMEDYLENNLEKLQYKTYFNTYAKLSMPPDILTKNLNFDYESLFKKVLQNIHRTRIEHEQDMKNMKTIADIKSFTAVNNAKTPSDPVEYNTEERLKSMKQFIIANKKYREKENLKLKRKLLAEEIDRFDNYEQLREHMENVYSQHFGPETE